MPKDVAIIYPGPRTRLRRPRNIGPDINQAQFFYFAGTGKPGCEKSGLEPILFT